jgi:L-arabinokinase
MSRTSLAYYITGHGLGHATRSMEMIRALLLTQKYIVHVISQVNATYFRDSLNGFGIHYIDMESEEELFVHHNRNLDTGAVQADVFVVDAAATLYHYYDQIHINRDNLVTREVEWLQNNNIQIVLCDAVPLGCRVGKLAGATTVLLSNFSWDFCFKEMLATVSARGGFASDRLTQLAEMVTQCEEDSSCCDVYLQLPGQTPLPAGYPADKVVPGPLIARQPRNRNLRSQLGIDNATQVLLVGFGGHSAQWSLTDSSLPDGWVCLLLGTQY